jgi:hypothetical protein
LSFSIVASTRPPALDALALLHPGQHVVHDRLIERGLLAGQVAVHLHLQLGWQVGDDRAVGLHPAQHERAGETLEQRGRVLVVEALDRDREPGAERPRGAEQPRVEELHDRPQLGQPVLHRGARQRHPPGGAQGPDRL